MNIAKPVASPLPWLLLLLSVTTGLVDAISVLGLGKVFTANMTGNIVFLGFAASGTPGFKRSVLCGCDCILPDGCIGRGACRQASYRIAAASLADRCCVG
jgi:hypothetical protein